MPAGLSLLLSAATLGERMIMMFAADQNKKGFPKQNCRRITPPENHELKGPHMTKKVDSPSCFYAQPTLLRKYIAFYSSTACGNTIYCQPQTW